MLVGNWILATYAREPYSRAALLVYPARRMTGSLTVLRRPSALIPLAMSLAALALVLGHTALYGVTHEPDEGAAAHTWQLLMAGQIPFIAFFAVNWLPRAPKPALLVLALQLVAGLAAATPVFLMKL